MFHPGIEIRWKIESVRILQYWFETKPNMHMNRGVWKLEITQIHINIAIWMCIMMHWNTHKQSRKKLSCLSISVVFSGNMNVHQDTSTNRFRFLFTTNPICRNSNENGVLITSCYFEKCRQPKSLLSSKSTKDTVETSNSLRWTFYKNTGLPKNTKSIHFVIAASLFYYVIRFRRSFQSFYLSMWCIFMPWRFHEVNSEHSFSNLLFYLNRRRGSKAIKYVNLKCFFSSRRKRKMKINLCKNSVWKAKYNLNLSAEFFIGWWGKQSKCLFHDCFCEII